MKDNFNTKFLEDKASREEMISEKKLRFVGCDDYYTILNAFYFQGSKFGFFSLVRLGCTNKLRQNQNMKMESWFLLLDVILRDMHK